MRDISAVEMQLRLSVNSPALLQAVALLLPLAQKEYESLAQAALVGSSSFVSGEVQRDADKWLEGILVAERALAAIMPPGLTPRLFLLQNQV